jgi:hypothetical protein
MKPSLSMCIVRRPTSSDGGSFMTQYNEWVEPGDVRILPGEAMALVIGPCEPQDDLEHDRSIDWLVLFNGRIVKCMLGYIGSFVKVHMPGNV